MGNTLIQIKILFEDLTRIFHSQTLTKTNLLEIKETTLSY
jgi:hypothetical protein